MSEFTQNYWDDEPTPLELKAVASGDTLADLVEQLRSFAAGVVPDVGTVRVVFLNQSGSVVLTVSLLVAPKGGK